MDSCGHAHVQIARDEAGEIQEAAKEGSEDAMMRGCERGTSLESSSSDIDIAHRSEPAASGSH